MTDRPLDETRWRAVADLYHDVFLGLVLTVLSRKGEAAGAEFMFNIFRRQQREKFLAGLVKLGIDGDPPAVAAAKYHYLSNKIGGVDVEYMYETDGKAWVRYAAPRWAWKGVVMCAIPRKVSEAMLWGWHSHNGVAMQAKSVGFVCTKQAVDGQDGLEGYYFDHGRELEPQERLRFARGEEAPDFDAGAAPKLASDSWPEVRLAKAHRNYAMEYAKSAMLETVNTFGPLEGEGLMRIALRIVGMQAYRTAATAFGTVGGSFPEFLTALIEGQGDRLTVSDPAAGRIAMVQEGWRLMDGTGPLLDPCRAAYADLLTGLACGHARRHGLTVASSPCDGASRFEMSVPAAGPAAGAVAAAVAV